MKRSVSSERWYFVLTLGDVEWPLLKRRLKFSYVTVIVVLIALPAPLPIPDIMTAYLTAIVPVRQVFHARDLAHLVRQTLPNDTASTDENDHHIAHFVQVRWLPERPVAHRQL